MTQIPKQARKRVRNAARLGVIICSTMLVGNAFSYLTAGSRAAAVGTDMGAVHFVTPATAANPNQPVTGGGSAAVFVMSLPAGAACPGSATGTPSYRWQTFMVADSVDVSALTYVNGPAAVGAAFVSSMFETPSEDPINNQNPAASPLGLIPGVPPVSFEAFTPGFVPAGTYKVGVACTTAGATVSFWSARITVTTAAGDMPAGFTWAIAPALVDPTTTTAIATTTTVAATTTTHPAVTTTTVHTTTSTVVGTTTTVAATSTTVAPTTTIVSSSGTTTSTAVSACVTCATATTARVASQSPTGGSTGTLASTGSSPLPIVVWALLLLAFGRIAILLARPVRTRSTDSR